MGVETAGLLDNRCKKGDKEIREIWG